MDGRASFIADLVAKPSGHTTIPFPTSDLREFGHSDSNRQPYRSFRDAASIVNAIGNLIEEDFGLASLGYADAYADDLSDCFNFNQSPLTFKTINAPLPADHFLHDRRPAEPPDDD